MTDQREQNSASEINAETLWWLREELRRREHEIDTNVLQVPDYPPLPPCPDCADRPNAIRHSEGLPDDLVTFEPCAHRFRITPAVKMELQS
jgi:hypothetical protein